MSLRTNRALVLIDGEYLSHSVQRLGVGLDFAQLRDELLRSFGTGATIRYYSITDLSSNRQREFVTELERLGYEVHIQDCVTKRRPELPIIIDATSMSREYDVIALLSGDGDFASLLRALVGQGKQTAVISLPFATNRELRNNAGRFFNLESFLSAGEPRVGKGEDARPGRSSAPKAETYYFEKGIFFEPYIIIRDILLTAQREVTIVDRYTDEEILHTLAILRKSVGVRIITWRVSGQDFHVLVSKLRREGRRVAICHSKEFHDRFVRVDNDLWHSGHSLKDLGTADALLSRVQDPSIVARFRKREEEIANSGACREHDT